MYAVFETGGKQYKVSPGDVLRVEKIRGEAGDEIQFANVIAFSDDDGLLKVGTPYLDATVNATIMAEGRGQKVIIFKFKAKKGYRRKKGHRQPFTEVEVDNFTIDGETVGEKPEKPEADSEPVDEETAVEVKEEEEKPLRGRAARKAKARAEAEAKAREEAEAAEAEVETEAEEVEAEDAAEVTDEAEADEVEEAEEVEADEAAEVTDEAEPDEVDEAEDAGEEAEEIEAEEVEADEAAEATDEAEADDAEEIVEAEDEVEPVEEAEAPVETDEPVEDVAAPVEADEAVEAPVAAEEESTDAADLKEVKPASKMTKADLMAKLDGLGVTYAKSAKKDELLSLLEGAQGK